MCVCVCMRARACMHACVLFKFKCIASFHFTRLNTVNLFLEM